jgi:hypothetical protein
MKRNADIIARNLIQKLWDEYLERVPYARKYADKILLKGGRVVHDHLAFRTLKTHTGELPEGILAIHHIIRCLGYQPAGRYTFRKKKLNAVHFEHPGKNLPKIFVSELKTDQLPPWAQQLINDAVKETPYLLSDTGIELLGRLEHEGILTSEAADVFEKELFSYFCRPWRPPLKETVLKLNDISQYAAWVLLHGNSVNHFAALVNDQGVKEWPDMETTCRMLKMAGIPMKATIEGIKGSKLQQSATLAVKEDVEVKGNETLEEITWTYAYFELIQRGFTGEKGQRNLFSGFLEEQSRHLFNMTQTREN